MNLVLFHSGSELPGFLECTFKQIRLFNSEITIHFITDESWLKNPVFEKYEVVAVDKDLFYSAKIPKFEQLYTEYPAGHFWSVTAVRLIYIENYLKRKELTDVYHFENDVLIYYDLKEYHEKFLSLYENMAITPGGEDRSMTGFMFIKNGNALSRMTQFFIDELEEHKVLELRKIYGTDMIHEMSLMKGYEKAKGNYHLGNLPILPFGRHAYNYEEFNSIFDPASWGQFVGGTNSKGPGAKPKNLYVSQVLIANPDYTVIWRKDSKGRKIPYFRYNDNYNDHEIKINNLHIHSKNLNLYMS